jgi:hypothetical protein
MKGGTVKKGDEVVIHGTIWEIAQETAIVDLTGDMALIAVPDWAVRPVDNRTPDQEAYDRSHEAAIAIHKLICSDRKWCNYPDDSNTGELADDESLPWKERQLRTGLRLQAIRHCQGAVDAENIAAHLTYAPPAQTPDPELTGTWKEQYAQLRRQQISEISTLIKISQYVGTDLADVIEQILNRTIKVKL